MRLPWMLAGALLVAAPGCVRDSGISRDRSGAAFFDGAPEVAAPKQDRCLTSSKTGASKPCEAARSDARTYVRHLSPGDAVCLEGGFGELPEESCQTRASVDDAAPDKVLLQIREAKPDSRWFNRVGNQLWFAEGALVDLYLSERGY